MFRTTPTWPPSQVLPLLAVPFLLLSCHSDPLETDSLAENPPRSAEGIAAVKCRCEKLLIGYYEMEDCQLYLPGQSPFDCSGHFLEVAVDYPAAAITFRVTDRRFCRLPTRLFACSGPCHTALSGYACEAEISLAVLHPNQQELTLYCDPDFLACAHEADEGFWFVLPYGH
ncbi:MAG: hypothetical protein RLY31_2827 [Bacteroidota bacterium]|jgi:hypothetical protein